MKIYYYEKKEKDVGDVENQRMKKDEVDDVSYRNDEFQK